MVVKTEDIPEVAVNFRGGGSFIDLPPLFSSDGESIFVGWKNSVMEYNTKTGKLIHQYKDLTDNIIGFSYHVYDSYNCLTACSENGKIVVWKCLTHSKLLEKKLPLDRIKTFSIIASETEELRAIVSYIRKNSVRFIMADLKKKSTKEFSLWIPFNKNYKLSTSKNYFSIIYDSNVCFIKFNEHNKVYKQSINESRVFTCLSCHTSEEMVLVGDNSGRVILWQNIFMNKKIQTVFHWHTLAVETVCFSPTGSYFYSGGNECVLVKWQTEDANDRRFVPRIAAEIKQIAVANNNIFTAVATKDNAIRIFDNTLNQTVLIQHLVLGKHFECGLLYDSRTRAFIMNGNQGHIQFYSPEDMSLLYSIDIVGQNKITNERECTMNNTEITKVALSQSSLCLATVEERKDDEYHNEVRLKFWHFLEEKQIFELNTCVEYPHEKSINSIQFQPLKKNDSLKCVTVGNDRKFKVWQLVDFEDVYKKGKTWRCHSVGFHRDMPCTGLSFSVDGSLMATGFGPILTLWIPDSCELKCSLLHPIHKESVKHVQFGYSDQCHLLVSASNKQLCVWNLLTLCMVWTVPLNISLLIADPLSTNMAVFTDDKKVFVFAPNSHVPVYSSDTLLARKKDKIVRASFFPSKHCNDMRKKWFDRSHIYFISSSNELYCLGTDEFNLQTSETNEYESAFSKIIPNVKIDLTSRSEAHRHLFEKDVGQKAIKNFLLGPTHMMPPVRLMCHSLLKSLVLQKEVNDVS